MDKHDETAKAVDDKYYDEALSLMDAWWRKGGNAYELTPEDVANALRKAAADAAQVEREAILAELEREHARGKAARIRYTHEDRQIIDAENVGVSACVSIVRARGKAGGV